MSRRAALFLPAVAVLVLAILPWVPGATGATTGPASACSGLGACSYTLNTSAGTGWATTTTAFGSTVSFLLPGEANATRGVPFTYKVSNVSGTTDRVLGSFVATDANSGRILFGSTDTNITVTQHCSRTGCYDTYKLINGTIVFRTTKFVGTTTTLTCSPSSFSAGGSTRCTATVKDLHSATVHPTGTVSFSTSYGGYGTFSHNGTCTLSAGSCAVKFTAGDDTTGLFSIVASFGTHLTFYQSQGSQKVSVTGN
ncbi:MAG: hypothetical protein L3K23_05260 [Thermoplasmata archaeon]|nr:hypothetical protein [Thermoplasmata archaeon]